MENNINDILILSDKLKCLIDETKLLSSKIKNIFNEVDNSHKAIIDILKNSLNDLNITISSREKLELVLNNYNIIITNIQFWRSQKRKNNISSENIIEILDIVNEIKVKFEKLNDSTNNSIIKMNISKLTNIIDYEITKIKSNI